MTRHLVLIALVTVFPGLAFANIAAPQGEAAYLSEATTARTPLEVVSETLVFDCRDDDEPVCTFTARYQITNPTHVLQRTAPVFYGVRSHGVHITVDGQQLETSSAPADAAAADAALVALQVEESLQHNSGVDPKDLAGPYESELQGMERSAFALEIEPGATVEVVASGAASPGEFIWGSYATTPAKTRHYWLGDNSDETERFEFHYAIFPIRTWAAYPERIAVEVRHPADWNMLLEAKGEEDGDGRVVRRFDVDPDEVSRLYLGFRREQSLFYHGGPLIGIGGNVDDSGGFRMRFGYEVAYPSFLLYSLNIDTDFQRALAITPVIEFATHGAIGVIPSASLGLGVPIRVIPTATAGMRFQASLHWPFVGFVTSLDVFPGLDPEDPDYFQATLMGQIAF